MRRDEVIKVLKLHESELTGTYGVHSLALFGSAARDEATATSDVDLLVEFGRPTGYFGLVRLQLYLEEILGCPVDLGTEGSLRPEMRARIEREAIRVGVTPSASISKMSLTRMRLPRIHGRPPHCP